MATDSQRCEMEQRICTGGRIGDGIGSFATSPRLALLMCYHGSTRG